MQSMLKELLMMLSKIRNGLPANLDYNKMKRKVESVIESAEPTDNQKKCIESFKTD